MRLHNAAKFAAFSSPKWVESSLAIDSVERRVPYRSNAITVFAAEDIMKVDVQRMAKYKRRALLEFLFKFLSIRASPPCHDVTLEGTSTSVDGNINLTLSFTFLHLIYLHVKQ